MSDQQVHVDPVGLKKAFGEIDDELKKGYPPGLSDNVKELLETPDQMLKRVLQPGETITGEFECYFPDNMIPQWKIVLLLIITCGLYGFVLLYRSIERWCYKKKCCTPKLSHMSRGKLGITNKGRIICWNEEAKQIIDTDAEKKRNCLLSLIICFLKCCFPDAFRPPTIYDFKIKSKIYSAYNVKQITQYYRSEANFIVWCVDYSCGVELAFSSYNFADSEQGFMTTRPNTDFFRSVAGFFNSAVEQVESSVGLTSNKKCLRIISNTFDRFHNGDIHQVCEDLCDLHQKVVECLPELPEIFVEAKPNEGKYAMSDKFTEVTIVDDAGKIQIPRKWLPLLKNERVINTYGEVYKMTTIQWIKSILTCGKYYCEEVRHLKFARSACVITNKRLIVMDIFQRAGTVPGHMANFSVQTRSLVAKHIWGGYVCSMGPTMLKSSIWTDAGEIHFKFPSGREATSFANALQCTVTRKDCNTVFKVSDDIEKPKLDETDLKLIPLLQNEIPISKFKGSRIWLPYGTGKWLLRWINWWRAYFYYYCFCLQCTPVSNGCSKEACGACFPWLHHIFSCALRPFKAMTDVVVTPNALITYSRERNYGCFGFNEAPCFGGCCITVDKYTVTWICSEKFLGYNLDIIGEGNETPCSRIWRKNCCGAIFCPIGSARYELEMDLDQISFTVSGEDVNKNWLLDEDLCKGLKCLDMVQVQTNTSIMQRGVLTLPPQKQISSECDDLYDLENGEKSGNRLGLPDRTKGRP